MLRERLIALYASLGKQEGLKSKASRLKKLGQQGRKCRINIK
jgi:hypothetical protein